LPQECVSVLAAVARQENEALCRQAKREVPRTGSCRMLLLLSTVNINFAVPGYGTRVR